MSHIYIPGFEHPDWLVTLTYAYFSLVDSFGISKQDEEDKAYVTWSNILWSFQLSRILHGSEKIFFIYLFFLAAFFATKLFIYAEDRQHKRQGGPDHLPSLYLSLTQS